ncbi:unnamed protein product [Ectocarpus sp. 6 AP-2014]
MFAAFVENATSEAKMMRRRRRTDPKDAIIGGSSSNVVLQPRQGGRRSNRRRPRQSGAVAAALASSALAYLLVLFLPPGTMPSASAFTASSVLLSQSTALAGSAASRVVGGASGLGRRGQQQQQQQQQQKHGGRRVTGRGGLSTAVMAAGWRDKDDGPAIDPFDEGKMNAQGQHVINWYPGHIAKAERQLQDYLNMVDVVVEVRDCRIPAATTHQLVPSWVGKSRPLIVVLNRVDTASPTAVEQWKKYLVAEGGLRADNRGGNVPVFFVDSKRGRGVHEIKKAALKAGSRVNDRRVRRGMNPRSVRVAVIGFPNVGKSALINRLIGKKVAKSMNKPGVTKKMNWVRLGGKDTKPEQNLELLDSPGIIPARQEDQNQALKLAICNDIGQASYDTQVVAAKMIDQLVETAVQFPGYVSLDAVATRYGIDPRRHSGEEYLHLVAQKMYFGEKNSAADKLLGDFRKGHLGSLSLEAPPRANAAHNRLPLKPGLEAGGASGAGAGTSRDAAGRPMGGGNMREPGGGVEEEEVEFGAAAKEAREFVGSGEFEGW